MSGIVQPINSKDQFDALRASDKVVLVDFYADWCGPCKMISPQFEKLAKEHAIEGVEFYKLNIDDIPEVAEELQIRSIPTFHAYKNSERIDTMVGANKSALETLVKKGLSLA